MSEQFPNPDSRVTLSEAKDRFGLEKARVDWRLMPIDKRSIRILIQEIQSDFERLGIGEVIPDAWLTVDDHTWPASLAGAHHHMGTTRMGLSPKDSVVDADAKVHGIHNLYIAGSSIFPTVGCANPTLTIVATALKLSDHLIQKFVQGFSKEMIEACDRRSGGIWARSIETAAATSMTPFGTRNNGSSVGR